MTDGVITNFYTLPPKSEEVKQLVILLHGLGSNGEDLISLAPIWTDNLPDAMFISPDAPFRCDMVPPGYPNSYQWFSLQNREAEAMLEGAKNVESILAEFIDRKIKEHKVKPENVALVGFSQGTMTALHVGLRYKEKLAGIMGYSGALLWDEEYDHEKLQRIPIELVHGEQDNVVPVSEWHFAADTLLKYGFDVGGFTQPRLMHNIDQKGIIAGGKFLEHILQVKTVA